MFDTSIQNATIKSTSLGYEDHGILVTWVNLSWDGGGVGFGGNALDEVVFNKQGEFLKREGHAFGMEFICQVLKTVGVDTWEKLPGTPVRVEFDADGGLGSTCIGLGHFLKDKWFHPKELAKQYFPDKE